MPDSDDPTVKELLEGGNVPLDPATQADLAKWFGLPSVTQLEEEGKHAAAEDSEMAEAIARRDRAVSAVDPALLDEIWMRTEERPNPIVFKPHVALAIESETAFFDHGMLDRVISISEPREVEIPDALIDELKECTPQALLRDLHRSENYYDKQFEWIDPVGEQRVDIVAEVKNAMSTRSHTRTLGARVEINESRQVLNDLRSERRRSWLALLPHLHGRTVRE